MLITDMTSVPRTKGEVGIEIEVEGDNLPYSVGGWSRESDGSLRGDSCEFVLNRPCPRHSVTTMLSRIYEAYKDAGTYVEPSTRQSVHVHINVQDIPLNQVFNFILLFIIFEDLLVDFCGDGRTNNLFCLRSKDAEYLISVLERASNRNSFYDLGSDSLRYSALNVTSLFKYGSLEFRSMRGGTSQATLETWISILLSLKDYAVKFETPVDILGVFNRTSVDDFMSQVFGVYKSELTSSDDYRARVIRGARSVKTIAYTGKWDELKAQKEKRKKKVFVQDYAVPGESPVPEEPGVTGESAVPGEIVVPGQIFEAVQRTGRVRWSMDDPMEDDTENTQAYREFVEMMTS